MAFCNSCGTNLAPGAQFCNKCGAAVASGPAAGPITGGPPPVAIPTPSGGGNSALKIVLIVIAVVIGLGILSVGAFSFFIYHFARNATHVTHSGDNVKVDMPFGSVETSKDPAQAAKDLGVDVYPGATPQAEGSATMTFGNTRTVTATFQSTDSPDKVCAFYGTRFPNANLSTYDSTHCSVVSSDQKNMLSISVQAHGGGSKITIATVNKKVN